MTRYMTLVAVLFAVPAFAAEETPEQAVLKDNPATKIQNAMNKRIDKALELSEYCSEHPNETKCVEREKAQHDKDMRQLGQAAEALKEIDKHPELKQLIDRSISGQESDPGAKVRAERKEFLNNIKEMCREPSSEVCKTAKQDYDEWKSKNR